MENKARYTVVGLFLIIFSVAAIAFVLWQARFSLAEKKLYEYRIYSTTSIAGLKENSFVEYKGLVIGSVKKIIINPKNIEQIEIILEIDTPKIIKKDSFAVIQSQGITGNKNIEIDGGSLNSPTLIPKEGSFLTIPLKASFFDTITKDAGNITENMNSVLVNLNALLNKENINNISSILLNLNESSKKISTTLEKVDMAMIQMNKLLSKDVTTTLQGVDTVTKEWTILAKDLQTLVEVDLKKLTGKLNDTNGIDKVIYNINTTLEKLGTTLDNINTNGGDMLFKTRDIRYGPQEKLND